MERTLERLRRYVAEMQPELALKELIQLYPFGFGITERCDTRILSTTSSI